MTLLEAEQTEPRAPEPSHNLRRFLIMWAGHAVSVLGSSLTNFGIGVWIYQKTGSATQFAMMMVAISIPGVVLSPFAGALVDRWDRRFALIVSEAGAGLASLALAALALSGHLQLWQIYALMMVSASFATLSWPAMSAAVSLMVPKAHLSRANSLLLFSEAISSVLGPVIGGFAMVAGGLASLVAADVVSFVISIGTLAAIRIPAPKRTEEHAPTGSLLKDAAFGWSYIRKRPGLFGLLLFFMVTNFLTCIATALFTPLALSLFKPDVVGRIVGTSGLGLLCGTLLMAAWGGPKKRVYGVIGVGIAFGLTLTLMAFPPTAFLLSATIFTILLWAPIMNTSSQSIWQVKVAPEVQGRVFSIRRVIAQLMTPIAFALAGPLADRVFTPGMAPGGSFAATLGPIFGTGPGAGIRVIFVSMGLLSAAFSALMLTNHRIRNVESELPDHSG